MSPLSVPVPRRCRSPQEVVSTPRIQALRARGGHRGLTGPPAGVHARQEFAPNRPLHLRPQSVGWGLPEETQDAGRGAGSTEVSFSLEFLEFNEPFYSEGALVFISFREFSTTPLTLISLLPVLAFSPKSSIFRSDLASPSPNLSYCLFVPSSFCPFSSHLMGGHQACPLRSGPAVCDPTL